MRLHPFLICFILFTSLLNAEEYPFNLPTELRATIHITSTEKEAYNNLQLGTNIHHFSSSTEKSFVQKFDPITVRFPHGLWANWYDWRRDVSRVFGDETFTYLQGTDKNPKVQEIDFLSSLIAMDRGNIKVGIDGLTTLNTARNNQTGKGYDMIWTFNMSADGADFTNGCPESVARYKDLIARGFEVNVVEMGNENFYPGQRSSIIPNADDYMARAKAMSAALKAQDPNIRVSVPLLRRSSWANPTWNEELTEDQSYYDAVSIHTYVGADPDNAANSNEAYGTALTARKQLLASITNFPHKVAPTKPIWLSEWGVKSGGPNAVSALGMVDCFLMMSENQNIFERANWFSTNGKLNSMVVWEKYTDNHGNQKERIKYPLEKTLFGSAYEITRSVLENSTLMHSVVDVAELTQGVQAVNARVVSKGGRTTIFVVNLSPQAVPFTVNMDEVTYTGNFLHKAMSFSAMGEERALGIDVEPLDVVKEGKGQITLPKYSINTIELSDVKPDLDFMHLSNGALIDKGRDLSIEARVASQFKEVSLEVNGADLGTLTEAPFIWQNDPLLNHMMDAEYHLKLVGKDAAGEISERSIVINTPAQWACTKNNLPHPVPSLIQCEAYDNGEPLEAYYDRSAADESKYSYREGHNVDLSGDSSKVWFIQGKEWLEYSIDVQKTGNYAFEVRHQTRRSPAFEALNISFPDEHIDLFRNVVLSNTGAGVYKTDSVGTTLLEKGRHILRFYMIGYGFDLDYFEWKFVQDAYQVRFNFGKSTVTTYSGVDSTCVLPTAPEKDDYTFEGWVTSEGMPYTEQTIVSGNMDVYPVWKIKQFSLIVNAENGVVSTNPQQEMYDINTLVTLTATPANGYVFDSWSGDYTGAESPLLIELRQSMNLVANFSVNTAVDKPLKQHFGLSPNPNKGTFKVEWDNNEPMQYKIFSLRDVLVQSAYVNSGTSIQMDVDKHGIFIIEMSNSQGSLRKKIMVNP